MFNWLKKSVRAGKQIPGEAVAIGDDNSVSESALSESVTLKDRGNEHLRSNNLEDAADCYRQAIAINPHYAEAYNNFGYVFQLQGNLKEAVVYYRKAIELNPELLPAHRNLGLVFLSLGQDAAAEACWHKVIKLEPEHAEALQHLGVIAAQRGDFAQAEVLLRRAIDLQPENADAHSNLGNVFKCIGKFEEAIESYCLSIKIKPDFAEGYCNLGFALQGLGQLEEAVARYRIALDIKPDFAEAHGNLAVALSELGQLEASEASYGRALKLKPGYAEANLNFGMLLLSLGRYAEAWPYHEYRYSQNFGGRNCKMPNPPCPQWQEESPVGKSLLIWPEQGYGDYIQFARYIPLLKKQGVAQVTLACNSSLKPLLETVEGVDEVISGLPTKRYDYWVFPLSLPLHFGTTLETIPSAFSYMRALPELIDLWRDRLPGAGFKVGLVWKGNVDHKNDVNRSLPGLEVLASLWAIPGVTFISLQKGQGEDEAKHPPFSQPLIHLGSAVADFADTAAIIEQLDLVICVDTSIAHLAGAMGKPCWVLLPAVGTDWRWLRDCEDSPWYPSMRLFRQKEAGKWDEPVESIRQSLIAMLAGEKEGLRDV